jgi:DNA-binding FrmR family transcriptional regulator
MTKRTQHATHPDIIKRLKRANGHLLSVIGMIEAERPCTDIAQQLHAVEKAITQAKRTLIQDHIDHCLDAALVGADSDGTPVTAEFKAITKFL